jgi:hypothetical protein
VETTLQPGPAASPVRQLAGFIAGFDRSIARLARAVHAALRRHLPTAVELVYENDNALAIGFGPTERIGDVIVSMGVYARAIDLCFTQGARLPDPRGLLFGSGQGRFLRLADAAVIGRPEVETLLATAVALSKVPLPTSGRGYTVIKSVSVRPRPRRPPR